MGSYFSTPMERRNCEMVFITIDDPDAYCLTEIFSSFIIIKERSITERGKRFQGMYSCEEMDQKKAILHRCGRFLRYLSITLLKSEIHLRFLQMILDCCPRLEEIHLLFGDCKQTEVFEFYRKQLPNVFSKLQQLNTISLGCYSNRKMNLRDHISFNELWCMNLRNLSLYSISVIEKSIEDWKHLHLLTSLALLGCDISGEYLHGIRYLESLETLELHQIEQMRDHHIATITKCSKLTHLKLTGILYLTDSCFEHIGKLPNLQFLELGVFHCKISEGSIMKICQIRAVHLCCDVFPIERVKQLIINTSKLRFLALNASDYMTDNAETFIKAVNEAIASRKSSEKFILKMCQTVPIVVENLSPRLILEDFPIGQAWSSYQNKKIHILNNQDASVPIELQVTGTQLER